MDACIYTDPAPHTMQAASIIIYNILSKYLKFRHKLT